MADKNPCSTCGRELVGKQRKHCSNKCAVKARRIKNKIKEENGIKKEDNISNDELLFIKLRPYIKKLIYEILREIDLRHDN